MYRIEQLNDCTNEELITIAQKLKIKNCESTNKKDLVYTILDQQASTLNHNSSRSTTLPNKNNMRHNTKPPNKHSKDNTPAKNSPKKHADKTNQKGEHPIQHKQDATNHAKKKLNELDGIIEGQGVLELVPDGYGFLRSPHYNYLSSPDDIYVPHTHIKTLGLKTGDTIKGKLRLPKEGGKYFSLIEAEMINGKTPEEIKNRISFESLTPLFPEEKLNIISAHTQYTTRIIDLFCPIGKGQRALIVAPPKAGKTSLITDIATSIAKNHPEIYLIILLIDERVEEANHMKRKLHGAAEVVASTFDKKAENHIKLVEIILAKAKRMVESGHDVCIIADGNTRIARAYNREIRSSGKTLSGGVDVNALHKPKRFFGAARNIEDGGSLTIIATALIDTGSRMDDLIFEEFKGTGNMECQLDRRLANKDIYPAIDIINSKTRKEELLQSPEIMKKIRILRHAMADIKSEEAISLLLKNMRGTKNNAEFLASMHD